MNENGVCYLESLQVKTVKKRGKNMPISLALGQRLKQAGLEWEPATHDYFAIPEVDMDDKVFAMSDMTVSMEVLHGYHAITFNGAVEWALDFVFKADAVWLPTETQLRELTMARLGNRPKMALQSSIGGYVVTIVRQEDDEARKEMFEGVTAEEAYASALLALL